jgi:hypothetical protein
VLEELQTMGQARILTLVGNMDWRQSSRQRHTSFGRRTLAISGHEQKGNNCQKPASI